MITSKNSSILIFGASGYLGRSLVKSLLNENFNNLHVYSRKPIINFSNLNLKQINGELGSKKILDNVVDINPEIIINLISLDHLDSEIDFNKSFEINVSPLWKYLKFHSNSNLKKIIYFSTIHVYEQSDKTEVLKESDKTIPKNIYGLTHKFSEDFYNYYSNKNGFKIYNLRLSNSFGFPYEGIDGKYGWNYVVNDLVRQSLVNKEIKLISDGSPMRDFIYNKTVFEIIINLLNLDFKSGEYNLSRGKNYSVIEIANKIKKIQEDLNGKIIPIYINSNRKLNTLEIKKLINKRIKYPTISNKKLFKKLKLSSLNINEELCDFIKIANEQYEKHN